MFLDFLEKRSEEVDDTPRLTDEEKLFLKVFGIEEDQPAAAMKEATYFTCIKKLSEAVAKTPLYLTQDTETGERRAKEHPLYELLSLRPNPYMTAVRRNSRSVKSVRKKRKNRSFVPLHDRRNHYRRCGCTQINQKA